MMNSGFMESTLNVFLGSGFTSIVDLLEDPNIDKAVGYEMQFPVK